MTNQDLRYVYQGFVNAQEATYLNAIQSAVTFKRIGCTLFLQDGFGQEIARFTRAG